MKLAIPFGTVTSHRGNSHFLRHKRGLNKVPSSLSPEKVLWGSRHLEMDPASHHRLLGPRNAFSKLSPSRVPASLALSSLTPSAPSRPTPFLPNPPSPPSSYPFPHRPPIFRLTFPRRIVPANTAAAPSTDGINSTIRPEYSMKKVGGGGGGWVEGTSDTRWRGRVQGSGWRLHSLPSPNECGQYQDNSRYSLVQERKSC